MNKIRILSLIGFFAFSLILNGCLGQEKNKKDSNASLLNNLSNRSLRYTVEEKYCEQDSDCALRNNCCNSCHKDYVNIYHQTPLSKDQCPTQACTQDCPSPSSFKTPVCSNNQCIASSE